ncbi:MAG: GAF domain-containing sensor histidine kinase [Methylacidiphilales bacterium]|nr:GAF domain-containing sensor histidine kinase [Candidatus Methylacidiphilales bacterium]NJR18070.1 GAF domain-containing sensor histidine kinase [Calothrix sp. CSU_2_0]
MQATEKYHGKRLKVLAQVVDKIHESLDLKTIFQTTVTELRQLLYTDRVAVFRFFPELGWEGEFVSEDVGGVWSSIIDLKVCELPKALSLRNFPAYCYFAEKFTPLYQQEKISVISDIYQDCSQDYDVEILERLQIRACITVPLRMGEKLWGLLCVHQCSSIREWLDSEIEFVKQIAGQLSIAIQQVKYSEQNQRQAIQLAKTAELLEQTTRQKEKLSQTLKELQARQTQLIQDEKMAGLGQLVAGIAHEINNPINFIYGNLSHLGDYAEHLIRLLSLYQQEFPETGQEIKALARKIDLNYIVEDLPMTLDSMQIGAERILQLIGSLRTFSRLDHAEIKPVDIHEGIDSTLLILQHRLRATPTSPTIEVIKKYGELPKVECYAAQLNQVFMNILGNAIDALEGKCKNRQCQNPQIIIHTNVLDAETIMICISDNGCGIAEEMRSRIFDPFFTTKEPGKGTGLGLSISHQIIVEKHGGQIEYFSKPGKSTGFWIEIPIKHGG